VIDRSLPRLYELDLQFGSQLHTLFFERSKTSKRSRRCRSRHRRGIVPGAAAPKLVSRELVREMKLVRSSSISRSTRGAASRPAADDARGADLCR